MDLSTPDETLLAISKPPLTESGDLDLAETDVLVIAAGFEDRAFAFLHSALARGWQFRVILIDYLPHNPENRIDATRAACAKCGLSLEVITYNRENPKGFGDSLLASMGARPGRTLIDISGMSRLLIVQTLVALCNSDESFQRSFVIYTEAADYPPTFEVAMEALIAAEENPVEPIHFLASGVFEVTVLPELSAVGFASSPTRLIAFPSFDRVHLTALLTELQPAQLTVIEGQPPSASNHWRLGIIGKINELDRLQSQTGADREIASTLDYRETLDRLLRLYAKHGIRERIVLSPTGSKMQSVAVGLFRAWVRDVQIVYPTSSGFCPAKSYTVGIGQTHLLDLAAFSKESSEPKRAVA
jgi:hypothetical protein